MQHFLLRSGTALLLWLLLLAAAQAQNVGIGTTVPTQTLDVNGSLRIRGLSGTGVRLPQLLPDGTLGVSGPVPATITPAQPSPLGSVVTGRSPSGLAVAGAYAYVCNQTDNTIQVFSLANPAQPVSVGTVPCNGAAVGLCAAGGYLYMGSSTAANFQIFSLTTPALPVAVATIAMPSATSGVAVQGSTMYVSSSVATSLLVFDISNPTAPVSLGSVATLAGPAQAGIGGGYLYLPCFQAGLVQVFDLAAPAAPVSVGTVPAGGGTNGAAALGNALYVANETANTLQTYSLSAPAAPVSLGTQGVGGLPYAVAAQGNYVYVTNVLAGTLQVLQIAVPTVVGFNAGGVLTSLPATSLGDNLGSHTATQTLALNGNWLANQPGATTGLRLDNAGQVGIGLFGQQANLEVARGTGGYGTAAFHGSARISYFNYSSAENTYIRGGLATSSVFLNDNGGNVGIGTNSANSRLSISPSMVEPKITLYDGGSTTNHFGFGISTNQLNYHVKNVPDSHVFYQGGKNGDGTQLLRLKGNGYTIMGPGGVGDSRLEITSDGGGSGGADDMVIRSYGSTTGPGIALQSFRGTQAAPLNMGHNNTMGVIGFSGRVNGAIGGSFILSGFSSYYLGNGLTNASNLYFTTSGTTQAIMDSTGRLGLGTNPQATLDVVRGTGGYGTAAFHGSTRISHFNYSSAEDTYIRGGLATSSVFLNDNGGNVGIGTNSANSRLSISPSMVEPKITLYDGGSTTNHFGFGISTNQLNYHVKNVPDSHVFYQGGKNGDGTQLLRLKGNGYTIMGPGGVGDSRLEITSDGGGSGGADDMVIRSYGSTTGPGIALQSFRGTQAAPLNMGHNNTMGVIGFSGRVNGAIGGSFILSGFSSYYLGNGLTNASNLYFNTSGTTQAIMDSTGRLGLGLFGPQATLDVARGTGPNGTANFRGGARTTSINFGAAENTYIRGGLFSSDVILNDSGGRVGIGTATPAFPLDVAGTIHATTAQGIVLDAQDRPLITRGWDAFTAGTYNGVGRWGVFMEPNTLTFGIPVLAGRNFQWATYNFDSTIGSQLMTLTQTGFLGLTNPSPLARLDIVSDNQVSSADDDVVLRSYGIAANPSIGIHRYRGTKAAPANLQAGDFMGEYATSAYANGAENASNLSGIQAYYQGDGTTTLTDLRLVSSGVQHAILDQSGNFGIGIATPNATLEVARGAGVNGTAAFFGTTRTSHFNFGSAEDTYIRGGKATSTVILNDTGGGVAIGTATAAAGEMLTVNGSTRTIEVHTPTTAANNMLAVAYGQVSTNGITIFSSSGNFTISTISTGHCRLTFTAASGLSGTLFDNQPVTMTLNGATPGFVNWGGGPGTGTIDIYTFATTGIAAVRAVAFSVFVP